SKINESILVEKEIATFTRVLEEGGVQSSIPAIFTYWASKFLSPRLREVFLEADISLIFAKEIHDCYINWSKLHCSVKGGFRILSLGSGDCTTEIAVCKHLLEFGMQFEFVCTDLNPEVMEFASKCAHQENLGNTITFHVLNLNKDFLDAEYHCVIANHSLHHFVELEKIFDNVKRNLDNHGYFIISDMIGCNGHARWPEALVFVEQLWELVPLSKRIHTRSGCIHEKYINYDCTISDPYEGIRAQDILQLLLDRFFFAKFVGHGNIIDVFIDRIYGNNFSPDCEEDRRFIDYVEKLNTTLIDMGIVKPTAMFATLCKNHMECKYSRWHPQFCLRPSYFSPAFTEPVAHETSFSFPARSMANAMRFRRFLGNLRSTLWRRLGKAD
ncbi:MAG: methyltransferase domain-containing protein, partial [Candidatus Competibacteraceae bacterium]|nr:methyltransferase domain-containing protein [Candidatus Competibacteraceae bacterium]